MILDDLTAPLGQRPAKHRRELSLSVPKVIAAALALFLGAFVVWVIFSDNPFGGEPMAAVAIDQQGLAAANKPQVAPPSPLIAPETAASLPAVKEAAPGPKQASRPAPPPGTKTVTIIDGKTGARQEILIPAPAYEAPAIKVQTP